MPELTFKDGVLTAFSYVQATRDYQCKCGMRTTLKLTLPENVEFKSQLSVKDMNCPRCKEPVVIPMGLHYVENFVLLTKDEEPE